MTFSAQLNATTICSAWTNSGTQTRDQRRPSPLPSGTTDTFTATLGHLHRRRELRHGLARVDQAIGTGTVTFTGSTITWNPSNDTFTFKLGTAGGTWNQAAPTSRPAPPGYTASANVTDMSGFPVSTDDVHVREHQWLLDRVLRTHRRSRRGVAV